MTEQTEGFSGGCRCGQVRYVCTELPFFCSHCHCRDCQYASGGAYSTIVGVRTDSVTLTGELGGYTVSSDAGNQLTRKFCTNCGSPMLTELHSNPAMLVLKAATLDDPSWLKPTMHIWTSSSQPWAEIGEQLPTHHKQPS